ncbi:MAG: TonB-dependent receptor [Flavobacteriaceae bacterium]
MKKTLVFLLVLSINLTLAQETNEKKTDSLGTYQFLEEVVVSSGVIDIAKERETPIAVSQISAQEVLLKVGNQEFPEIMNKTPGVYATKQGGGYGDSRISLRGFDQRNTSFLINGQPVNDMENGWVYWSNWQGLTDVASGIQVQRGLGASKLAVPSVGGTVSIFTKSAEKAQGGSLTQMVGNDGYVKTTAAYNTGVNDKGWSSSYLLTKWSGNGYVYNTSGAGWTYFAAVGYTPEGSNHSLNLSLLGAGQWHHQRDVWVSIRDYENFGEEGIDQRWNTNGGTLDGEEFNMRRNFYNKPLATFNWDWKISDNVDLATSLYGSAGRGGGTGPRGRNYDVLPYREDLTSFFIEDGKTDFRRSDGTINYDAIVTDNRTGASPYTGAISRFEGSLLGSNGYRDDGVFRSGMIRRASMNSHNWVGGISNLNIRADKMRYSIGVDLRNYRGFHYRVLNNLMGFDGYYSTGNKNSAGQIIETTIEASPFNNTGLQGPKIDYYNIGYVGWQGFNGLAEYSGDQLTAVIQAGLSNQSFQREDLFDQPGTPLSEKKNVGGGYLKGGANYNLNENSNVFFNAGYISRQPNFGAVFPNYANKVNEDLQNEKIQSLELGYGYIGNGFKLNVNVYSTVWGNRFVSRSLSNQQGVDGFAQFKDIDVVHNGIEIEGQYRPSGSTKIRGMLSIGDWRYTKDFEAELFDDNQQSVGTGTLYLEGAKVGDAAQFVAYVGVDHRFGDSFSVDLDYRFVDGLYADYSITDSAFTEANNPGALKLPSYGLVDLGATFRFGNGWSLRGNINNLLNTTYIAESNSNIHASAGSDTWNGVDKRNSVWFGFGRTWNLSLRYQF